MPKRNNREMIKKEEEFVQRVVDVARVTRVMAGGKRMKFRVCLAIGDKKGRVGAALGKGADVSVAIGKALTLAKKNLIKVPIVNETIAHPILVKFKSAKILLRPAQKGTGIKAGGAVRIVCELAGIPNITAKILGSSNKVNNVRATLLAFQSFKKSNKDQGHSAELEVKKEDAEEKNRIGLKDKIKNIIKKV